MNAINRTIEEVVGFTSIEESLQFPKFRAIQDGYIIGFQGQSTADYTSLLSVIINGNEQNLTVGLLNTETFLTPVVFGEVKLGDCVEFKLSNLLGSNDYFYSDFSLNSDQINHFEYVAFGGVLKVGAEDIYGGGDLDFDDSVGYFTNIEIVGS